ncbi:MAG: cupin domain-containing protein [Hyphomicrobiaceae bacterium]
MSTLSRFSPADMATWPVSPSGLSRVALSNADIEVRHYAPKGHDPQTPHDRDELYFVNSGHGMFECNGSVVPFNTGDALFAAAGDQHRFLDFSDDFATWVLFYGAKKD